MNWSSNRTHKYNAVKVENNGKKFASKLESSLYDILLLREQAGEITDIELQPKVYLTDARILLIADFKVFDKITGGHIWYEAKGMKTPVWAIKRRLWFYYGPGILRVYKGSYKSPKMVEQIIPKTRS